MAALRNLLQGKTGSGSSRMSTDVAAALVPAAMPTGVAAAKMEAVHVSTIKRDIVKFNLGRLSLEGLLTHLFELYEPLPEDTVRSVYGIITHQIDNMIVLMMNTPREARPELESSASGLLLSSAGATSSGGGTNPSGSHNSRSPSVREFYRVNWVASILIKDGDPLFRTQIASSPKSIGLFLDYYAKHEAHASRVDPMILNCVTRSLCAVAKEHQVKLIDTLCSSRTQATFAGFLVRFLSNFYVARLLPSLVRVADARRTNNYAFYKVSKKGVLHLHLCNVYEKMRDQVLRYADHLYPRDGTARVEDKDVRPEIKVQYVENSLVAMRDIWLRVLITSPPKSTTPGTALADYADALVRLNLFRYPQCLIDILDRVLEIEEQYHDGILIACVFEAISGVFGVYEELQSLDPDEEENVTHTDCSAFNEEIIRRLPRVVDIVKRNVDEKTRFGRAPLAILTCFSFFFKYSDLDLVEALVTQQVPKVMVDFFFNHERVSMYDRVLETIFEVIVEGGRGKPSPARNVALAGFLADEVQMIPRMAAFAASSLALPHNERHSSFGSVCDILLFLDERDEVKILQDDLGRRLLADIQAERDNRNNSAFTKVKSAVRRKRNSEMITQRLDFDGDNIYYMNSIREKRRQMEGNNKFSILEFFGIASEESSNQAGAGKGGSNGGHYHGSEPKSRAQSNQSLDFNRVTNPEKHGHRKQGSDTLFSSLKKA
ncbi:hypothetical protein FVE85_3269 [Porphyridium purpureum]|uniref:Uncharacterized protein n=1 Tax=Porphyridium purpureum TaxID=35688 RepID=A0A5J4YV09_PORPP|nr:hypothetical protein FVE85_3269 [Porphyridium purpureum]|eukprot:POR8646..scf227_4